MPVYEYQGKHYDLSETDPAAAKTKIQGFLEKEKPSQAAAFGKSAFESAGSAAGGLAGAEAGLAGGAALGAMTGPFAPVAVPAFGFAGSVVGGLGGGYAGEKIQEKLGQYVPESVKQATGFGESQRKAEQKEYPTTSTLGRLAPDIAVGGKALYDFGKLGYRSAKDLAQSLLQRKTGKSQAELAQEAERLSKQGQTAASTATKEEQAAAAAKRKELETGAKPGEGLALQETKAAQAEAAGKKATASGGRTLRELAGVRTLGTEGAFKPIPQTATDVGNYIRQQAENFVKGVKAQRDKAAKASFSAAKNDAATKQALGQFVDTQPIVNTLDSMIAKGGSTDYLNSLKTLKNDLAATKDFEGLEIIRRRLGDAGFGLPEEGYKAIGQGFAKEMYTSLSGQMKSYSKNFEKYLDDYKRLSQNLEAYGSKVGKGITDTQDAKGLYYSKTAEQIANDIFSSPEKFKTFMDAVGGNKEIAYAAARRYFAGLAEKAKTSEAVNELMRSKRAILDQVEDVRKELVKKYLNPLLQAERRTKAAGAIQKESTEAAKQLKTQIADVDEALGQRLKGIESGKTIYSDAINTLSSAEPGKAVEQFNTTVLPNIRKAEEKSGVKLIDESQIQMIRKQVQQLDQIADKARREVVAAQIAAGLFGLGAAYGVGKKTVEVLGGQ